MKAEMNKAKQTPFVGVGVGPGDPELITLKAARLIQHADVICYIANTNGGSQARTIAQDLLKGQQELPIKIPMSDDRTLTNTLYDQAALDIQAAIDEGQQVVFLCEGDPLFFGSFAYLLERLQPHVACSVVPGISSINAAAAALLNPLTVLTESFAVVSGRHHEDKIVAALQQHESVVIMKAGRSRQRILRALQRADRSDEARYLEYISREQQVICTDISQLENDAGPYFSLFVVTPQQRDTRT